PYLVMRVRPVSKYRDSSSRTSSASRLSEREVNPTRSANSTDTRRRSAEGGSRGGSRRPVPRSGVPHSPQNLTPGSLGEPQDGQATASGLPHSPQNFRPGEFTAPQLAQVTTSLSLPPGSGPRAPATAAPGVPRRRPGPHRGVARPPRPGPGRPATRRARPA